LGRDRRGWHRDGWSGDGDEPISAVHILLLLSLLACIVGLKLTH